MEYGIWDNGRYGVGVVLYKLLLGWFGVVWCGLVGQGGWLVQWVGG